MKDVKGGWDPRPHILSPAVVLVVALAVTFFAIAVADRHESDPLRRSFAASLPAIRAGKWWTPLSSAFSQPDVLWLVVDGLLIAILASRCRAVLGSGRTLIFALTGAVVASAAFLAAEHASAGHARAWGPQGMRTAMLVFLACESPRAPVDLMYASPSLWIVAVSITGLEFVRVWLGGAAAGLSPWTIAGGAFAGIAAWGLVALRRRRAGAPDLHLDDVSPSPSARRRSTADTFAGDDDSRLDAILAKISASGMASLTPEERGFLERASKRKGGGS